MMYLRLMRRQQAVMAAEVALRQQREQEKAAQVCDSRSNWEWFVLQIS
jgi:hypothetical protein